MKHLTIVRDGTEARGSFYRDGRFARAPRPDLILLALRLPAVDGREVLAEIKTDNELRDIPVVIMTAASEEDRILVEVLLVDEYMIKPLDMHKFIQLVKKLKTRWHADTILPSLA